MQALDKLKAVNTMAKEFTSCAHAFHLLSQLESIFEANPLLDEVGFVHPSQFAEFNASSDGLQSASSLGLSRFFWHTDRKLAISTEILYHLYSAAKQAFLAAGTDYRNIVNVPTSDNREVCPPESEAFLENEVMRHSKAVLLLSCDMGSAWNSRKLVASRGKRLTFFTEELRLSALVLSHAPKSEQAWTHRRWVIKTMKEKCPNFADILRKESDLVKRIAERSKMNYRAWHHCCWLVSYMTKDQVLDELNCSRRWAESHVADSCCFHYRQLLLLTWLKDVDLMEGLNGQSCWLSYVSILWKEELDWNRILIRRYPGREALWGHRRFLSPRWLDDFANHNLESFLNCEVQFVSTCLSASNDFEDAQVDANLAASYLMWILKHFPGIRESHGTKLIMEAMGLEKLKIFGASFCTGKKLLFESLRGLKVKCSDSII